MALSGVPLFFSGFWSKDQILEAAHLWSPSHWPFYLCISAAFLTAFYMTRQLFYVFFGNCRIALGKTTSSEQRTVEHAGLPAKEHPQLELAGDPHESPKSMLVPLVVLAGFSIVLGFVGTPAWPWFQAFLDGRHPLWEPAKLFEPATLAVMSLSAVIAVAGIGLGYWLYGREPVLASEQSDRLERLWPNLFELLRRKYFIDEVYEWMVVGLNARWAQLCDWVDRWVWTGIVQACSYLVTAIAWVDRFFDEYAVNSGFDEGCRGLTRGARLMSRLQDGRAQHYLRVIGIGLIALVLFLVWGCQAQ
jgi:NADH-quinone oxidoreductase subunit L